MAAPEFGDTVTGRTPLPPLMERGTRSAGCRYDIAEILRQGVMCAVYKAKDY